MGQWIRAVRLPFVGVSALPFVYGYFAIDAGPVRPGLLALGLAGVVLTHLAANLANDIGDAVTGADGQVLTFFGFFGGSKLIQEGVATLSLYLLTALGLAAGAAAAAAALSICLGSAWPLLLWVVITVTAWEYSLPPLRLCYHMLGEITVFTLFGMGCVLAGVWLRGHGTLQPGAVMFGLPHAFLITAILVINEVPDRLPDLAAGKRNLVNVLPRPGGVLVFAALSVAGLVSLAGIAARPDVSPWALTGLVAAIPAARAAGVAARHSDEPARLVAASRAAIAAHALASAGLLAGVLG